VRAFPLQKSHGLDAVGRHVQADGLIGVEKGFLRQPHIAGAAFDQEYFFVHVFLLCFLLIFFCLALLARRQLGFCQPKTIDAFHEALKFGQLHGLGKSPSHKFIEDYRVFAA
jgi:hypothetical protein